MPDPLTTLKEQVAEYFAAKQAHDDATRPSGGFGHPKVLKHHDPIVQRLLKATQTIRPDPAPVSPLEEEHARYKAALEAIAAPMTGATNRRYLHNLAKKALDNPDAPV